MPRHREIGAIDLQGEPSRDNRLVFRLHRGGERFNIGLVGREIFVLQERRDNSGEAAVMNAPEIFLPAVAALKLARSASSGALSFSVIGPTASFAPIGGRPEKRRPCVCGTRETP